MPNPSLRVGADMRSGVFKSDAPEPPVHASKKVLRPFGKSDASPTPLGWTGHMTFLSKVPFYAVRFNYVNASSVVVSNMISAFATPDSNPTPCVTTASWTPVTVGGLTTITMPAATYEQPGITQSDIMPVTCIKRTDGEGYLLMVRQYVPAAGNTQAPRTSGTSDLATDSLERLMYQAGFWSGGDAVTNPGSFVRSSAALGCPVFVELFSNDDTVPILLVSGDSIVCGQGGGDPTTPTAHQNGAYKRFANIRGMIPMCGAVSGAKSPDYIQQALDKYMNYRAAIAVMPPWSINDDDSLTAGVEKRILYNMARWLDACDAAGTVPVFLTPAPRNGITVAQETVRRSVVAAVKDFCITGKHLFIDRDSVWTDYSNPAGGYLPGIYADDLHPNSAGYDLELALWLEVL